MSRKLKLQVQISVDGFIAGSNGEMDFMTWNWGDDIKRYVEELTDSMDTIILGRKLAEGFIPYWATVAQDKDNPEHEAGKVFTNTPKIVFSKTLDKSEWINTVLAKGNLKDEITKLKNSRGKDLPSGEASIIVYGGAEFVSNLIGERLIDEIHLFVNPVVIGKGKSIFQEVKQKHDLELIKSEIFDCGINVLAYKLK